MHCTLAKDSNALSMLFDTQWFGAVNGFSSRLTYHNTNCSTMHHATHLKEMATGMHGNRRVSTLCS
jgi:hypothetical protein